MRPVLNRAESRALDEHASAACGVPSLLLMDAAGRGAAEWLIRQLNGARATLILCGPGNNGGDGWVVARRLLVLGRPVRVMSSVAPALLMGDAARMFAAYAGCGGAWERLESAAAFAAALLGAELVVDALFGTGLSRSLTALDAEIVGVLNASGTRVVALDLPSGLDADTGGIHGVCVRATETITFGHPKLGLLTPNGMAFGGRFEVVDIGIPPGEWHAVGQSARCLEASDVRDWLVSVPDPKHKGEAGRVLVVAGSKGTLGAARLTTHAALRAGAGLVTLGARPECAAALESTAWEVMLKPLKLEAVQASLGAALTAADSLAIGPGLGLDAEALGIVRELVLTHPGKIVVDADALTHFAGAAEQLAAARGQLLLTPHPAEAARLLSVTTAQIEADRFDSVRRLADATQACVLLKGVCTLICSPGCVPIVNPRGASTLAVAGSGDVLTGIIAALVCHLPVESALAAAAWIHGVAGERAAAKGRGALAREIADYIPGVVHDIRTGGGSILQ